MVEKHCMELHCLGTAGYHPNQSRHTSCYALPDLSIVLDAGSGFFRLKPLLQSDSLHILLSHTHLDHVVGLTFVYCLYHQLPLANIHVYALQQKLDIIREHLFHEQLFPITPPLRWHALEDQGSRFQIGEAQIEWFELEHPGGSIGYRIEHPNTSFAYITDTTSHPDSTYWNRIQGVDWLLHECNFSDEFQDFAVKTGHSWQSAVVQGAAAARVKNLVLTHFDPNLTDVKSLGMNSPSPACSGDPSQARQIALPEQIILAADEMRLDIGRL